MSAHNWTTEQKQAITDRGGTLLLSAAAGSGKTAVLTQRAVELIADPAKPVSADRLLIVTFTNAAAAELRARMAAALDEKLAAQPDSTYLKRQKLLLGRASICTVDSFCIDLLTQNFNQTDLPGDFTVIKPAQETALRAEALAETLEEAYQQSAFRDFASLYGKARSDAAAGQAVEKLYDISRTMADPAGWWASLAQDYTVNTTPAATRWGQELLAAAAAVLQGVDARLAFALQLAREGDGMEKCADLLAGEREQAAGVAAAVTAGDWQAVCDKLDRLSFATLRFPKGSDEQTRGCIKGLRDECKTLLKDLREKYFVTDVTEFLAEQAICLPMVQALSAAVTRFAALLYQKKLELGAFGFDDFEHAALALLQTPDGQRTALSQELGDYYAIVMVDEYQDTNDLQDTLYRLLAKPDGGNLFFVGDVKQSIYGFRQAKPEHFIQKRDSFAPYDGVHYPATVLLASNFRSTPAVLHSINDIFAPLFCRAVGGVDYAAGEALIPGIKKTPLAVSTQLLLTDTSLSKEEKQAGALPPAKGDDSDTVAAVIRDMLAQGAPVREGDSTRPCRAGDFCILLRSPGTKGLRYAEKLEAMGIGAACQAQDELLADPQVGLLLSFLRVLDNPGQDIHLAAVMLCPVFGFTPDDLVALRSTQRKGTLYAALLQSTHAPVVEFLQALRRLRGRSLGMPVQDICAMLLDEVGLYRLAGALPGGEGCCQNLRAFQAVAAEYAGSGGLAGFLRLVDAAVQNDRPLADKRGHGTPVDRVQIMSIHGSKGLEFPIVILANASQAFNEMDANASFLCHSDLGVAFKLQDATRTLVPTLAVRGVAARMRREAAGEEMRLLYVALTRARDRLLLSWADDTLPATLNKRALVLAATGGVPDTLALTGGAAAGMSHWLMLALLTHPDAALLRGLCDWQDLPLRWDAAGRFGVSIHRPADAVQQQQKPLHTAAPDPALAAALAANFAAQPPAAPPLPVKVSVSALSHKNADPVLEKPAFLYKQGMSAAQKGTALHRFLQLADLAAARADLPAELDRLVQGGYIDPDQAAGIELPVLRRFLQSDLVQRMLSADALLREYEFISSIPASLLADLPAAAATAGDDAVFLLGIADCVAITDGQALLVDYKTDHGKTPQQFLQAYATQLSLYRDAIQKRLGVPVTRSVIYSFALGQEIEVPH